MTNENGQYPDSVAAILDEPTNTVEIDLLVSQPSPFFHKKAFHRKDRQQEYCSAAESFHKENHNVYSIEQSH
mgnify:CR=1 FL=1